MVAIMTCLPRGSDAVFGLLHRGETPKFLRVGVTITSGRGSTLGAIAKNCVVTHTDMHVPKQPKTGARVCSCFGPISVMTMMLDLQLSEEWPEIVFLKQLVVVSLRRQYFAA